MIITVLNSSDLSIVKSVGFPDHELPHHLEAGQTYIPGHYDSFEYTIQSINGVLTPVLITQTLGEIKAVAYETIRMAIQRKITGGVQSSVLGSSRLYPTQATDQSNMSALFTKSMADATDVGYKFWCQNVATGEWLRESHTKVQIQAVGMTVINYVIALQDLYDLYLENAMAATTETQLTSVLNDAISEISSYVN